VSVTNSRDSGGEIKSMPMINRIPWIPDPGNSIFLARLRLFLPRGSSSRLVVNRFVRVNPRSRPSYDTALRLSLFAGKHRGEIGSTSVPRYVPRHGIPRLTHDTRLRVFPRELHSRKADACARFHSIANSSSAPPQTRKRERERSILLARTTLVAGAQCGAPQPFRCPHAARDAS
jgi:hypothetical protein